MKGKLKDFLTLIAITLVPTLLIWAPFYFRFESFWKIPLPQNGMATIVANYDGPLFLVVAKTLYNPDLISQNFSFPLPTIYYAAHFPLFPVLARLVATLMGFPYSMLTVTLFSSFLAIYFFKKFISDYVSEKEVYWLTFVFSVLPARWLIVRSVGSAEPLFIATIVASLYYFKKEKYFWAGIWGVVAQLTKSAGILLFMAYALYLISANLKISALNSLQKTKKSSNWIKSLPVILIPLALLGLFFFYQIRFDDFFAYFHSGDNIHLFFPPFQIFNYSQAWVGTFWLEEIILIYLLGGLGLLSLIKQGDYKVAWFVGVFFASILFVSHRDLMRYSLPIVPFLLASWSDFFVKREFKIILALTLIPIYLFSLSYISQNVMPISDWRPFL